MIRIKHKRKRIFITMFVAAVITILGIRAVNWKYRTPTPETAHITGMSASSPSPTQQIDAIIQPSTTALPTMTATPSNPTITKTPEAPSSGTYKDYVARQVAANAQKKIVLFFYLKDSPSSVDLDADIQSKINKIPPEISILKVDFSTENALKEKYIVNYDHTLVQIDSEGNLLKKWSGSATLEEILMLIQ